MPPAEITQSRQLLVEGKDAEYFFRAYLRHLGRVDVQLQDFGGISQLRSFLKALRRVPGFARVEAVGIVRDAEGDAQAAVQSVQGVLKHAELPAPGDAARTRPRVTVLILPDGNSPGCLETLCLRAVDADPVMPCVDEYFRCVEQRLGVLPKDDDKARLHAFLASREKSGLLLGQAASAGYFPWDCTVFQPVAQWLNSL